jgi:UDP-N-acetylglucosamine--N-acetylmuramyl-(pentapeptide) pyrophosphoryl-undecaprenol N-acetylglucosamine transferase
MQRIAITGGHHNSALVVAEELRRRGVEVIWLGHRHASRRDPADSAEYLEVKAAGFPFYDIPAGRGTANFAELLRIPGGILAVRRILTKHRVEALLTFGSYLGLAGAIAAATLRLSVYVHEQTVVMGRANRLAARVAEHLFLTWESSRRELPGGVPSTVVGLPVRPAFLHARVERLFPNELPTLLILGGKQGSHIINQVVFRALPELLQEYNIIHQTGLSAETGDYQQALALQAELTGEYHPAGYIEGQYLAQAMKNAALVIGRSGAHTTYELALLGTRALLIPYLHTHKYEQHRHAELLAAIGQARILPEHDLSVPHLLAGIAEAQKLVPSRTLTVPRDAASRLVDHILGA